MNKKNLAAAVVVLPLIIAQPLVAATTSGELLVNPSLDADASDWTVDWEWAHNSGHKTIIFQLNSGNTSGKFVTSQATTVDLKNESNVTSLQGYDANTTRLSNLTFNDWRYKETSGNIPSDGTYNFYIEVEIFTTDGNYRGRMAQLTNPWQTLTEGATQTTDVGWFDDTTYLGNPFLDSGIVLSTITNLNYNVVMHVESATTDDSFGWFVPDDFSVTYEVTSVPEAKIYALILGSFAFHLIILRRKK